MKENRDWIEENVNTVRKRGIGIAIFGFAVNLALALVKTYVGISSNSLSVYCDSLNNYFDTVACLIAFSGFYFSAKLDQVRSKRAQSLATFVICMIVAITGALFVYNGLRRYLYPLPVSYSTLYLGLLLLTIAAKVVLALVYGRAYKKQRSEITSVLVLDSVLDCGVTAVAIASLLLVERVNYAVDAVFAIVLGVGICVAAVKLLVKQTKILINGE